MAHLVMHRGEDRTWELELNRGDDTDLDLTGATLAFVAYLTPDTPLITADGTLTDPAAGLATVTVLSEQTDTEDFSETANTTLFYVLRRTVSGHTDIVDAGLLIVRYLS